MPIVTYINENGSMISRHDSHCIKCDLSIAKGDDIDVYLGNWLHYGCKRQALLDQGNSMITIPMVETPQGVRLPGQKGHTVKIRADCLGD